MRSLVRVVLAAVALAMVSACGAFRASCASPGEYVGAEDLAPLKTPVGLDAPDTRAALKIPPLAEPERPRAASEDCLESPPKYAQQRPAPTPGSESAAAPPPSN